MEEDTKLMKKSSQNYRHKWMICENPITDPKSAKRLTTCPPPKFSGDNIDYIPWKRTWEATMGRGTTHSAEGM